MSTGPRGISGWSSALSVSTGPAYAAGGRFISSSSSRCTVGSSCVSPAKTSGLPPLARTMSSIVAGWPVPVNNRDAPGLYAVSGAAGTDSWTDTALAESKGKSMVTTAGTTIPFVMV